MSASGRLLIETLGNGLTTQRGYDQLDRMTSAVVSSGGGNVRQYAYTYDTIGNVIERQDTVPNNVIENFQFDRLNRLASAAGTSGGNPLTPRGWTYTATGNIDSKSDVGTYTYLAASNTRPHAVSSVTCASAPCISADYIYDANGNLTTASGTIYPAAGSPVAFSRTLTYMSFNLPASLSQTQGGDSYSYTYTYSADHERVRLVTVNLAGSFTTVYLHPAGKGSLLYEKETKQGSPQVEHKNFIQAGAILVGVYITRENPDAGNPAAEMRYFHADHLGSVVAITNEAGAPLERLSYESFGERRHLDGSSQDRVSPVIGVYTDRGFTSHEHLDEMNLIHMNGRIYDPALARFMTADPFIQAVNDLQGYNRYSYLNNNPLAYTDPSGYFRVGRAARVVAAIAIAVFAPEAIAAISNGAIAANSFAAAAIAGGLSGAVATGNLQGALQGALTGGLFNYAVGVTAPGAERIITHAIVGCISAAAGGGKCGSGALSAGFAQFATGQFDFIPSDIGKGIAVAVVGGTASVIGGGKFENGAATAAFGYLFSRGLRSDGANSRESIGLDLSASPPPDTRPCEGCGGPDRILSGTPGKTEAMSPANPDGFLQINSGVTESSEAAPRQVIVASQAGPYYPPATLIRMNIYPLSQLPGGTIYFPVNDPRVPSGYVYVPGGMGFGTNPGGTFPRK